MVAVVVEEVIGMTATAVMLEDRCERCGFLMHYRLDESGDLVCLPTETDAMGTDD